MLPKLRNKYFRRPLKLYWWRYEYPHRVNFGDELTPLIIESLFGRRCIWTPPEECEIAGAGSIIEVLLKNKKKNRPILWGSGFIKKGDLVISPDDFNIKALRGKSSLERTRGINKEAVALGDPGLLASYLIPSVPEKKYLLGIVPHYVDLESPVVKELSKQKNVKIISPLSSPKKVIYDIAASEYIISSSLHGLIVADSFLIPNLRIKLSNEITGGNYKFNDYSSAVDKKIKTIDLLANSTGTEFIHRIHETTSSIDREKLLSLQKDLIKSFPNI